MVKASKRPSAKKPADGRKPTKSASIAIYALLCPETGVIRYVGKARDPHDRLRRHLLDARRRKTPLYAWVRRLLAGGSAPRMEVIEFCRPDVWPERERHWIAEMRRAGAPLLNLAEGGDEPFCPPDVRKANGASLTARREAMFMAEPWRREVWETKRMMMRFLQACRTDTTGHFRQYLEKHLQRMRDLAVACPQWCGEWATL